jgi:hypothetical protein
LPEFDAVELALALLAIAALAVVEALQERGVALDAVTSLPAWARWSLYYGAVLAVILFGRFDERQFIYFQF